MRLGVEAAAVDGGMVVGDVEVEDGRIAAVGLPGEGGRGYAVPGFVELQVNGFAGVDFMRADAAGYRRASEAMLQTGVTAFQPTLITADEQDLVAAIAEVPAGEAYPRVLGVHLEGPFLSPRRLGVHPAAFRRDPDLALAERLLDAGPVTYVTLAPELPGALELVDFLHERGVVVSLGHTDATAEEAEAAFDRGVRTVTHLFNAMRPFRHRDPGIVGAALVRQDVVVQLILDGHHVAPETAKIVLATAPGRVALVTDAIAAAGAGDGAFALGDLEVNVNGGVARNSDGALAGSSMTMLQALRNACELGVPLGLAAAAVSSVPAQVVERDDLGSIRPGSPADVVVLDDTLALRRVLVAGRERVAA
jgi:N-acetylglucosamine-6-phosphate deacetylase